MGKQQIDHFEHVDIEADLYNPDDLNCKVRISTPAYNRTLAEFAVPRTSVESHGSMGATKFLPAEIVRFRCLRDFKFTFGTYDILSIA